MTELTGLLSWTLDAIRSDHQMMSWLEERRLDWVPVASRAVKQLMEGVAVVIITDKEREWFGEYLVTLLNNSNKKRPFLPIFHDKNIVTHLAKDDGVLVEQMLTVAFNSNCIFWYIGSGTDILSKIPKKTSESFLWIIGEEVQNSFYFRSNDDILDIKLIHLARLFDKTISAVMFGKVSV